MPKSIDLSSSNLKYYYGKLIKNFGWVFLVVLLIIIFFEFFEISVSAQIVLNLNQSMPPVGQNKSERVNFEAYDQIIKRIDSAKNFNATSGVVSNPFDISAPAAPVATTSQAQAPK